MLICLFYNKIAQVCDIRTVEISIYEGTTMSGELVTNFRRQHFLLLHPAKMSNVMLNFRMKNGLNDG